MNVLKQKLLSRKFLLATAAAAAAFVAAFTGHEIPWEGISVVVAYVFGEAGVDVVREIRRKPKTTVSVTATTNSSP